MRHYLLGVFACLTVFLVAAAPAFTIVPTVIIYPLAATPALDREASARIVGTLATQIAAGGAIKVLPPSAGVERQNYLADARAEGANYYVTGFITPLGSGASVVEQVVSTTSGTMVYSVTNYISTLAEIASQGDQLRAGILDRSSRGIQAFAAPPPSNPAPTPQATNGADVNVNKLFNRKTAPAAPPATATLAILAVGGSAASDQRNAAAHAIAEAFEHAGRHAIVVDAAAPASAVCAANKATAQVAAWLDTPAPNTPTANSALRMIAYDCSGNVAFDRTFNEPLAAVTGTAVSAYLSPPAAAKKRSIL